MRADEGRAKAIVALLMAATAVYLVLLGQRGVWLLTQDSPAAVLLGVGILALPVIGVTVLWSEARFGLRCERLAHDLAEEGWTPEIDPLLAGLPRRPSGRVDRAAADEVFGTFRQRAEHEPENWRVWFQLAAAYDAAGDRSRARAAARHAIQLEASGARLQGAPSEGVASEDAQPSRS